MSNEQDSRTISLFYVPSIFPTYTDFERALLTHAQSLSDGSQKTADYSEAFGGGSLEEYKQEKEFEKLVAGTEGLKLAQNSVFEVRKCVCMSEEDDNGHAPTCPGKWIRTLNLQGNCFLYIHTITHEITGSKPYGFFDEAPTQSAVPANPAPVVQKTLYPVITAGELPAWISKANAERKTLVILSTEANRVKLFGHLATLNAAVFDTKAFVLPLAKTGIKFPDAVESLRQACVSAMKAGTIVCLDCADKVPGFREKICENDKYKELFPLTVFNPRDASSADKMFKLAKGDGFPTQSAGFALTVSSTVAPEAAKRIFDEAISGSLTLMVIFQ